MSMFRAVHLTLESVSMQQIVGGKSDGKTGVMIYFVDFLISSVFLDFADAIKLRDALNAMSEGWKQGRKEEE